MSKEDFSQQTVGELVVAHPQYAIVFQKYGIDYCCGGGVTLNEATASRNIDLQKLNSELQASDANKQEGSDPDWTKVKLSQLVRHIVETYHVPLREKLSFIKQLAGKVASVHAEAHPEMETLAGVFSNFKMQLELHMQKEEVVLFPAIIKAEEGESLRFFGCGGGIEHPIAVMTGEHDDASDALKQMRQITNNFSPPADACNSFRVLLSSLEQLENEMHQHVHKENHILFPRALELTKLETCQ